MFSAGLLALIAAAPVVFGQEINVLGLGEVQLQSLSTLLLIVPFVLLSATAGQLSDKLSKTKVIRAVKLAEIGVMALAGVGFGLAALGYPNEAVLFLLALVFLMGVQSTFFGPSKYAAIPELLSDQGERVSANALVELGTYFAVLGGTFVATFLVDREYGLWFLAGAVLLLAVVGWILSLRIPMLEPRNPTQRVNYNPLTSTWDVARIVLKDRDIFEAVLGISWFWALGAAVKTLLYSYVKVSLHADVMTTGAMIGAFAVGIGIGSIACEKLSFGRLEIGLVPVGAFGLFVGLLGMFALGEPWAGAVGGELFTVWELAEKPMFWVLICFLLTLSAGGGFFMVPLYTLVQDRADPSETSRIIGANNIINSIFIVGLQGGIIGLSPILSTPQIFGILAALNLLVAIWLMIRVPEFALRFIAWILSNFIHRVRVAGEHHVPREGSAVLICNHVSFVDFLIIMGAVKRPARFVMDKKMSQIPVMRFLFKAAKVIPITSYKEDPALVERAMDQISEAIQEGWLIIIFPEGGLTWDGKMMEFKSGIERILERDPVPVVPMTLNGLWGSFFSRLDGPAMTRPFRRGAYNKVHLTIDPALDPAGQTAEQLRDVVHAMWIRRPDAP